MFTVQYNNHIHINIEISVDTKRWDMPNLQDHQMEKNVKSIRKKNTTAARTYKDCIIFVGLYTF